MRSCSLPAPAAYQAPEFTPRDRAFRSAEKRGPAFTSSAGAQVYPEKRRAFRPEVFQVLALKPRLQHKVRSFGDDICSMYEATLFPAMSAASKFLRAPFRHLISRTSADPSRGLGRMNGQQV